MPLLPGVDYTITAAVTGPLAISDNQVSPSVLFSYAWAASPNATFDYSIVRGAINEVGRILVSTNGTIVSQSLDKENTQDSGVTLNFVLSGANIEAQYTSTATGQSAQLWYNKLVLS